MKSPAVLTREQVRRIDELAQKEYGLSGIVLMENAGRGAAELIDRHYGPAGRALIACGTGNNGGDGLVIARHLHMLGWKVSVLIAGDPEAMSPDCAANDRVVRAMKLPRYVTPDGSWPAQLVIGKDWVVIDALLGTGFRGIVRPQLHSLIERLESVPKRATVAIDIPSGLDCDTGQPGGIALRADRTITFVARKPGFETPTGVAYTGTCEVVGIGVPPELITRVLNS